LLHAQRVQYVSAFFCRTEMRTHAITWHDYATKLI
jgi:hypothetical protein